MSTLAGLGMRELGIGLGFLPWLMLEYKITLTDLISKVPYASIEVPEFGVVFIALYYVGLGVLLWWIKKKKALPLL